MLAPSLLALVIAASPSPNPATSPSPQRILALIRERFRSHRPPPAYETYTLIRAQNASNGYPDPVGSYTKHFWVRNVDRAALSRLVFRDDARGPLRFDRPAFNEPRDPGPPTADVFEPAPQHPHPVEYVPTPEPSYTVLPVIGGVQTLVDFDYRVESVDVEGNLLHLHVVPKRDPDRNRIREIWADKDTYALRKLAATDKLFVDGGRIYGARFLVTVGDVGGYPVVTEIHGIIGDGYNDDGKIVDFHFRDIAFPSSLPAWYFDPRTYARHGNDAPS
jgi:hypothetical protein